MTGIELEPAVTVVVRLTVTVDPFSTKGELVLDVTDGSIVKPVNGVAENVVPGGCGVLMVVDPVDPAAHATTTGFVVNSIGAAEAPQFGVTATLNCTVLTPLDTKITAGLDVVP